MSAADGPQTAGSQPGQPDPVVSLRDFFPAWSGPDPAPASQASPPDVELAALRADFPGFRIWPETVADRTRYVARSQRPGLNPHTVVTADLAELRTALGPARWPGPPR